MATRNKVTVTDAGQVKVVTVGTQGPSGSASFLIQGKTISAITSTIWKRNYPIQIGY